MGTNCHIMIETPEGQDNLTLMHAADLRWISTDAKLRLLLGIPNPNTKDAFWEHLENHEYQLVLDAALVHREVLSKQLEDLFSGAKEEIFGVPLKDLIPGERRTVTVQRDLDRTEEWIGYYEIAATLVKLGHQVVCYGA